MKGYFIEVTNNLLDPKHRKAMKDSVWLFMWLLDKMTSITEEGIGRVLGGKPIKWGEASKELGISRRTYQYWLKQLKDTKYINLLRTPHGCVITVNKAKKRFGRSAKNVQRSAKPCTSNIRQYKDNTNTTIDKNNLKRLNEMKKGFLNKTRVGV